MQQRRLRLGDIVDDYCPRERRVTNHAIVALIDDEVKQTRCTTCDADHDYKQAKVPAQRRKKESGSALDQPGESVPRVHAADRESDEDADALDVPVGANGADDEGAETAEGAEMLASGAAAGDAPLGPGEDGLSGDEPSEDGPRDDGSSDDGPVHRPLIRATLPRIEGQLPERKPTDFTVRQPGSRGGRPENGGNGHRQNNPRDHRRGRGGQPSQPGGGGQYRFGSGGGGGQQRQGGGGGGQQRQNADGNRAGAPGQRRGGRGRKRGR